MTEPTDVILGWAAPKIKDQFPQLHTKDAEAFQRDHDEIIRLKMRGLIPPAEHKKALQRLVKRLSTALKYVEDPSCPPSK